MEVGSMEVWKYKDLHKVDATFLGVAVNISVPPYSHAL